MDIWIQLKPLPVCRGPSPGTLSSAAGKRHTPGRSSDNKMWALQHPEGEAQRGGEKAEGYLGLGLLELMLVS